MAIRKPNLSVHEARHLSQARNAALDNDSPLPSIDQRIPAKPSRPSVSQSPPIATRQSSNTSDIEKVSTTQVFLSAPLPAGGVSRSFDYLSKQYSPAKALRMVLRRALDEYEHLLEMGGFEQLPGDYPVHTGSSKVPTIQTSRIMPITLLKRARAYFDPLGFESDRAFGRKLACAALAAFFASEMKR